MVQYDRAVIQEFAERLYNKANSIIEFYTIVGLLLGGVGGYWDFTHIDCRGHNINW